jgi:PAT family beta-lactamase induction signal transducer AmpG
MNRGKPAISRWRETASVYLTRKMVVIFLLGVSSGLPSPLVFGTLSIWLKELGLSRTSIGVFSLVLTAYTINFLWAPLIDRLAIPVLTRRRGRRRSWGLVIQVLLLVAIFSISLIDPAVDLYAFAVVIAVVAFLSASQDIVIDAYRIEYLEPEQYGAGAAMAVYGWMTGANVVGGFVALYLAEFLDWQTMYQVMAAFVLVGIVTLQVAGEPPRSGAAEADERETALAERLAAGAESARYLLARTMAWLYVSLIAPFRDFMTRDGWLLILLFIVLFKVGDAFLGRMANVFYVELDFSKSDIAEYSKAFGLVAFLVGGAIGGLMVKRYGMLKALLAAGILMSVTNLLYAALALSGKSYPMFATAVFFDNLTTGMSLTAFVAYLSSLCNLAFTATHYALLASLGNFARTQFGASSGWIVDQLGGDWALFFCMTVVAALPGLALLVWMIRRFPPAEAATLAPAAVSTAAPAARRARG